MKYIDEFRNTNLAKKISAEIKKTVNPGAQYRFMEFCGGHTHAIHRYNLSNLLPENIDLIHGPGCPVCVLPIHRLDQAIYLAQQKDVILCSYGDMLRVPGSNQKSLLKAKAQGARVQMVYSIDDAVKLAQNNSTKKIIFFAVGFETTTPPTAAAILEAAKQKLKNFFVFCNHILTPPALAAILSLQESVSLNGIIGPSHVSVVIGSNAYSATSQKFSIPIVIAGFEPLDILQSILMLIKQVNHHIAKVENQYTRAVTEQGNQKAKDMMTEVLELREKFAWRGLGEILNSALQIKQKYEMFDAEKQFVMPSITHQENNACQCGKVLCGLIKPNECHLFASVCTPENPMGACMVSSEGACAAHYLYRD